MNSNEYDNLKIFNSEYVDKMLIKYIPKTEYPQDLYESMNYSLFTGGKRIRPILLLETCNMLDGEIKAAEQLAAALEMIHTYSLIHDDLPCMDDDDFRRGLPTNHKKFGYATAVLAGDALLNLAFETIINGYEEVKDKSNYMKAAKLISDGAGVGGMVSGQAADLLYNEETNDKTKLDFIYKKKTGALLRAAVLSGALLANISNEQYDSLERYANNLGLMFQITDDIIDMQNGEAEKGQMTYISVYGLEKSREKISELLKDALDALKPFADRKKALESIVIKIASREK